MAEDKDLLPGETALLHTNKHILVMLRRVAVPTVVVLVIVIAAALLPLSAVRDLKWFIILAVVLGLFVYLDIQYIIWRSESYTITDQRVLYRRGVLGKFTHSVGISRVQDVSTAQGILGRIFNYGTIEIESAGKDGADVFTYVPNPESFRNVLFERLHGPGSVVAPL